MEFRTLIDRYVMGIMRQSEGVRMNNFETFNYIGCRNEIKQRLATVEWLILGLDSKLINILMQMGDTLLQGGNAQIALSFYREASYMFPRVAVCHIRQAQCQVALGYFDQAKKACIKGIALGDAHELSDLLSIIDKFMNRERFQEACDVCLSLMARFPMTPVVHAKLQVVTSLLGDQEEREKQKTRSKKEKSTVKESAAGVTKKTGKSNRNIKTSNEKLSEASGGVDVSASENITRNTGSAKVVKTTKQLKREQIAKEKEIQREIEKAKKAQEEMLRKREEVEARKRKEQEEKEEKRRKQEEMEARERKQREENEKLEKKRNDEIKKRQEEKNKSGGKKSSNRANAGKGVHSLATPAKKSSSAYQVLPKNRKISLNDMSADFDKVLSSGSRVRRVCPTCNTPRAFSYGKDGCHSCKSELVIWCNKVGTDTWVKPRKPPKQEIHGPYTQCKHFQQGKMCVKTPCTFAHGQDEVEVWDLCRNKRVTRQRQSRPWTTNNQAKEKHSHSLSRFKQSVADEMLPGWNAFTSHGGLREDKTNLPSLQKSWSCMTLNYNNSTSGSRSRTDSLSSLRSLQPSSNAFDVLSSDDMRSADMLDEFDLDSEYSSFLSQDVFDQSSEDESDRGSQSSSFSLLNGDMDVDPTGEDSTPSFVTSSSNTPANVDTSEEGWTTVGRKKTEVKEKELVRGKKKKNKRKTRSNLTKASSEVAETISLVLEREKLRCRFCDNLVFSSTSALEDHYSDAQHKLNVVKRSQPLLKQQPGTKSSSKCRPPPDGVCMGRYKLCRRFEHGHCYMGNKCTFAHGEVERSHWIALYRRQIEHLTQLQNERLLAESFSEKIRRKIQSEGRSHVLKETIPGVTVNCNSLLRVKLDGPRDGPLEHTWIFSVRIQTNSRLLLSQVAFLSENHLDKFQFLPNPSKTDFSNTQCLRLVEKDFVKDPVRHTSEVQFCIQFSSSVFGDFEQTLVFDFGHDQVLAGDLFASVVSKDICGSEEDSSSQTTYCCILEWSTEQMELILCKDLMKMDMEGLCEQYSIPDVLPDPAENLEFTRETYCNLWHNMLFIEEQHIQREVARYDIQDGQMKIVTSFESVDKTVYATQGELFGEIYLYDYLVMDEAAGNIISRSVESVIVRPKVEHSQSQRVYECSIELKTSQSVVIKLNELFCADHVFEKDQIVLIDLKFKYNRLSLCEMHQAIDMCKQKTALLLPEVKNVSYKNKRSIHDWFMDRKPNDNQHEAIAMILDPSPTPPILVIGPFGTGKTFTLNLASEAILRQSESNKILVCTHSNSAANIHLSHLHDKKEKKASTNIRPLRVLNPLRKLQTVPYNLREYCLIEATTNTIRKPRWDEVRDHNIIITTLATARLLWKFYQDGKLRFTHILIDEAAQALEPECVIPLVMADRKTKVVLAGDHKQMGLPVYSKFLWPEGNGPSRSLLERFHDHYSEAVNKPGSSPKDESTSVEAPYVVLLSENYRCHADILKFPSDCFYGGELVAKGDQSTHDLLPVLSFYTAQGEDRQVEGSLAYYNDAEVAEVVTRVQELVNLWPKDWPKNIGVLTPYRDQVQRIREGLRKKRLGYVNVETVENVQGKEFKALFISTVRTMNTCSVIESRNSDPAELDFGFLSDPRFLNTAITRAQSLLAVVGDPFSLCSVGSCRNLWKDYLQRCDANKGLYGCTLKIVMDFCLCTQTLDPTAHEFTPSMNTTDRSEGNLLSTSSEVVPEVSAEENAIGGGTRASQTELNNGFAATSGSPTSTSLVDQDIQAGSVSVVDGHGEDSVDNVANNDDEAPSQEKNDDEDVSESIQSVTGNFFRLDGVENYDKIIEALIKACKETKKKDQGREQKDSTNTCEDFPPLSAVPPPTSAPHWPNLSINQTFSAGLRDGRIELGFHVKDSERLFRLTSGHTLSKKNEKHQSDHDIEAYTQKDLLKLLEENPTVFTKCTFRIDSGARQRRYYGQLTTPDSPDIHIPGRVRGVYEDDVVVLELQRSPRARGGEKTEEKNKMFGFIKGVLRRLIEPKGRQYVCTVDRANSGVMVPINKRLPKLMNFTKTDEKNIIPIYTLKDEDVARARILKGRDYDKAIAGELVFVVKFLQWRTDCPFPLGLAVRHMPQGRDFQTAMEILYEEHNIKRGFNKKLRASVKRDFKGDENWQIPVNERGRPVYRNHVFTIDPPESLDLDDAIGIRSLGNGNYELHIHIADVSYFVHPNTNLDEEARSRGTSYYPQKPEETVPMLPRELSEGCCSLFQDEDRLAVTVTVEVTPDGTVVGDARIERTVVRSCSRLTYHQAQMIIDETRSQQTDNRAHQGAQIPVNEAIGVIHRIAQGHRRSRLGIERSLYHQKNDDLDDPDNKDQDAHSMIEEIMIIANHLVAKHLLERFPNCTPLRAQPPPKTHRVLEWRQRFQKFLKISLGLEWLGDAQVAHEGNVELKVPIKTWKKIMTQVNDNLNVNFQQLVKLVCDFDLFPQLALANVHQQRIQQRGRYVCSGDSFEVIPFPWAEIEKNAPADEIQSNIVPDETNSLEDNEGVPEEADAISAASSSSVSKSSHYSAVSNDPEMNRILYGHSSLRLDAYCHFTSPIRRYIDIIVHRLLVASIEGRDNTMTPDDIATLCDRCTFFARNARRFDQEAKKLQLAVDVRKSMKFVTALIEEVAPDSLKLFFDPGKFEVVSGKSVRIARLGPDKDPEKVGDSVKLDWTLRFLRLHKHGRAQPKKDFSDEKATQELADRMEPQTKDEESLNILEVLEDDYDFTVSEKHWNGVLEAVKNQDEELLRTRLQKVDENVKKKVKPESSTKVSLLKRVQNDPSMSTIAPYQHPNAGKEEPSDKETDEFIGITRSFKLYDRVKVQICSQVTRGILSPAIQLFQLTDKIQACVEHRSFPTTCFAKTPHQRPDNSKVTDVTEYVRIWEPVLMMEIATSAVQENDVITLSNLRVKFEKDSNDRVTIKFDISIGYCEEHFLDPLDLNLMCVRVKDPDGSGKDEGYWVGHFQISEELRKRNDVEKVIEQMKENEVKKKRNVKKGDEIRPVVARLVHSSSPVPESLIAQTFCYITVELILLSTPNRRCLGALHHTVVASELVQDICIGKNLTELDVDGSSLPSRNLSLGNNFNPLNRFQQLAVEKALTKSFTLIQGPPGTGKTVTGVHIAYWFAHMNKTRKPTVAEDGEECNGSMVFYCGPSNKSVDVVARHLMTIPGLKILRIYGQEIERKEFPVPVKVTLFRSKHISAQLKADEELRDVSLHHVIRSKECPFADEVRNYDETFMELLRTNSNASRGTIKKFNEIKSKAEAWAITQTGVNVILATCTTAYSPRILGPCGNFVCQCIIDECGMCIEAETLCAMLGSNAKQVVLIGDHKQLQPIIKCDQAKDLGLGTSMFERFSEWSQMLEIQYRMHKELCRFPSEFFYDGKLKTAEQVLNRKPDNVRWPNGSNYPFVFYHVEGVEESLVVATDKGNENSKMNQQEVAKVVHVARRLTIEGVKLDDIVVLSPYRAQCHEISEKFKQHGLQEIRAISVVASQGSEKNYVILSLVRSLPEREIERNPSRSWLNEKLGFITDEHQINVALTRAKRGLCIIGNANLIGACSMWRELLEHYEKKGCLQSDLKHFTRHK